MTADWSQTNLSRLRFAWEAGFTAQEIADQFGDGRTRNSIIGKAHALGLPPRAAGAWRGKPAEPQSGVMLSTKGYRKAYASKGDDPRARFVRVAQAPGTERHRRVNKMRLPGFESPFIQEGRAKFPKSVQAPNEHILVSGHNNIKIGKIVRKGALRGYWIYTLSLEERKTCPSSCQHWQSCYGNNMPFAKRVDHTHPDFFKILETAVAKLCAQAKSAAREFSCGCTRSGISFQPSMSIFGGTGFVSMKISRFTATPRTRRIHISVCSSTG